MFNLSSQLGIKSYSFRDITEIPDLLAAVKECGVDGIDLSACHVNYEDIDQQDSLIEQCHDAGIRISGIGVANLKCEEAFNRRFFSFAERAGCGLVSCSFEPQDHLSTLKMISGFCDEYGVRAAIHNHGGRHWLGNPTALRYIFANCGKEIGLCLDTAWCLQAGGNPLEWLDIFGERLYGVHFKDFTFSREGKPQDVVVGQGALDLPDFLEKFGTLPFEGSAVIEFEGPDAVKQSARGVTAIRSALGQAKTPVLEPSLA